MAKSVEKNNIGLDFGTTYSIISRLENKKYGATGNLEDYRLEAWLPSEGSGTGFEDSIVVRKKDGKYVSGSVARNETGRMGSKTFKGFKMMIAERDSTNLQQRGYDEIDTPIEITKTYLSQLLEKYTNRNRGTSEIIDKIVVGVPEIWFSDVKTADCRTELEKIINSFECIKNVELISEPAAACACFVENYRKNTGEKYNGKILVIDYGGGTLDIALCDVVDKGNSSDVSVVKRCGAGLNEDGYIGKAGLAFIEEVVKIALRATGKTDEEIVTDSYFYAYLNDVENALMTKGQEIVEMLDVKGNLTKIEDVFCSIQVDRNNEPEVTYGMLAQAYDNVIKPILDEKMNEVIKYMDESGINYSTSENNFKIAMVGGFCNFFLTQRDIEKKFHKGAADKRFKDIILERDRERAISFGATLVANDLVSFKPLSPYHLGVGKGSEKELKDSWFVVHKGQEITYDKPMFVEDEDGEAIIFRGNRIPMLVFSTEDFLHDQSIDCGEPIEEYKVKMSLDPDKCYKIGFSFDKSMIITLHTQQVERSGEPIGEVNRVRLDKLYEIFGNLITVKKIKS